MNPDGYITKAEYIRRLKWNNDVLSVTDSIKSEMMQKTEEVVLDHFDMDMSDLREYMRDKEEWKHKQAAMPKWIPVTERLPKEDGKYLVLHHCQGRPIVEIMYYGVPEYLKDRYFYIYDSEWGDVVVNDVTYWLPISALPELPEVV